MHRYYAYFGIKIGDQDKSWAPHKVCKICVEDFRNWTKGKKKALRFGIPMVCQIMVMIVIFVHVMYKDLI